MSVQVSCPSCGAAIVFQVGSGVVAVCPHCRTAVARLDRAVEDLGKVAAVVESGAVLKVGLEGRFDGVKFQLTGRTQMKHSLGGVWDEWYAAFTDGRWGWLAEAQGRFYLTFDRPIPPGTVFPAFNDIQIDERLSLIETAKPYMVAEKGIAAIAAAEGELPWRIDLGAQYPYVDLSAEGGGFATLDYSGNGPPTLYAGRQVTLDDLNIPKNVRKETWELKSVPGKKLSCPNCGGSLDLRAPDKTERIGCPYCGSLLDATQGELRFLSKPDELLKDLKPSISLGTVGNFGDGERTVIGFFRRSVTFDRIDYFWDEFLLYHPRDGFEWLTVSDDQWNRVKNVSAAEVASSAFNAVYQGNRFRIFQNANATMRAVIGECYWKVTVGETEKATDFVAPPLMLSRETTLGDGTEQEVNWSLGTYLTPAEVQKAFNLPHELPQPSGVAPNQPFLHKRVYLLAAIFLAIFLAIAVVFSARTHTVLEQAIPLTATPSAESQTRIVFTQEFELKGSRNVCITANCPELDNTGISIEGDLIAKADSQFQPFVLGMGHYHGVEDGEAWSEGSRSDEAFVSAQAAGTYSLRLEVDPPINGTLHVRVEQGVVRMRTMLVALIALLAFPIGVGIYHVRFEMKRWKDSDFAPIKSAASSGTDDD